MEHDLCKKCTGDLALAVSQIAFGMSALFITMSVTLYKKLSEKYKGNNYIDTNCYLSH